MSQLSSPDALNEALLQTLFEVAPLGVAFFDVDLKYRRVSDTLEYLHGIPAADHIGRTPDEVLPDAYPQVLPMLQQVLETGEALINVEVEGFLPDFPDEKHAWLISSHPVRAENGVLLGLVKIVREITEQRRAEAALRRNEEKQRVFLRDILFNLSEGKLHLCETPADLPPFLPLAGEPIALTLPTLRTLRKQLVALCQAEQMPEERWQDMETGVGEAAMNAVVHGGPHATARLGANHTQTVQVWVTDKGAGIALDRLHRATLERGFTTAGSLGHGWPLLLKTCDRVYLLTGENGTTVVVEQDTVPPQPPWLRDL